MDIHSMKDEALDALYPMKIRKLSGTHWTPIAVARKASAFLSGGNAMSILDLGSGVGKFCLIAASQQQVQVTGVEQRENLVKLSRKMAERFKISNLDFISADLKNLPFEEYDSFYFFNSFEENINLTDQLDKEDVIDLHRYQSYINILRGKFEKLPPGTRIVTYCGDDSEIPGQYRLVKTSTKGKLKFWEKELR